MKRDDGVGEFTANPFEDRDSMRREAVVISPRHDRIVGIGSDDGDVAKLFMEGEGIVLVAEEDDTFPCHFGSMFDVTRTFDEINR
jgi:hypothetical protein